MRLIFGSILVNYGYYVVRGRRQSNSGKNGKEEFQSHTTCVWCYRGVAESGRPDLLTGGGCRGLLTEGGGGSRIVDGGGGAVADRGSRPDFSHG